MKLLHAIDDIHYNLRGESLSVWFILCLAGLLIAGASWPVGVGVVTFLGAMTDGSHVAGYAVPKSVGYLYALNWSVMGVVVLPTIVAFGLRLRLEMERAIRGVAHHLMARDEHLVPISEQHLLERWAVDRRARSFIPPLAGLLGFMFVAYGWWAQVAAPLIHGHVDPYSLRLSSPDVEFDWSISALMALQERAPVNLAANFVFDAVAYLMVPGLLVAYGFATMFDGGLFVAVICNGARRSKPATSQDGSPLPETWTLAPDLREASDRRCGFAVFEGFFTCLLACAFFIMIGLFLVITQNAYLRDPQSANILEFFGKDWSEAAGAIGNMASLHGSISQNLSQLLMSGSLGNIANPKSLMSVIVALMVVAIGVGSSWIMLRSSAIDSQEFADDNLEALCPSWGLTEEVARGRLDRMQAWPLAWISEALVLAIIMLSLGSLLSFRFGLMPVALGLSWALYRVVRAFVGKGERRAARAREAKV